MKKIFLIAFLTLFSLPFVRGIPYIDTFPFERGGGVVGVEWGPNGTRMYKIGTANENIYKYSCKAYGVFFCSYVDNLSVSARVVGSPEDVSLNNNGTKLYVVGNDGSLATDNYIHEWSCSDPYNLSSCSYLDNLTVSGRDAFPRGMAWNEDGTKMYLAGKENAYLYEFSCSAWDISSCSYTDYLDVSFEDDDPTGIAWEDNKTMWMTGNGRDRIYKWSCSAWDISSCTLTDDFSARGSPQGIDWSTDGTKMYVNNNQYSSTRCATLNQPGVYNLTDDIINASSTTCIGTNAADVTLDCKGYEIDGLNNSNTQNGVDIGKANTTIKNCRIKGWTGRGIKTEGTNTDILDNEIYDADYGVFINNSNPTEEVNVTGNNITAETGIGYRANPNLAGIHDISITNNTFDCNKTQHFKGEGKYANITACDNTIVDKHKTSIECGSTCPTLNRVMRIDSDSCTPYVNTDFGNLTDFGFGSVSQEEFGFKEDSSLYIQVDTNLLSVKVNAEGVSDFTAPGGASFGIDNLDFYANPVGPGYNESHPKGTMIDSPYSVGNPFFMEKGSKKSQEVIVPSPPVDIRTTFRTWVPKGAGPGTYEAKINVTVSEG